MKIQDIYSFVFSPTHTSQRIAGEIVRGFGGNLCAAFNFTYKVAYQDSLPADAMAVFVVPVYGGRVAPLALERMKHIRSLGGPAVIAVVYGNRAYGQALEELDAFVTSLGFKVVAAGTFIGEHSYSTEQYPISSGRPDADDLEYACLFGQKLRTKVEQAADYDHLYVVDVRKILRPRQPFFPLIKFAYKLSKLRKSGVAMPRTLEVDESLCTHCGACVNVCPTEAIQLGEEIITEVDRCIRCCACVKACPQHARSYDTPFAPLLHTYFKREKENRIIL